jgi:hypothetical protein
LLAFYDFPAEHWKHLRTSNPVESTFATVRHRTNANAAVSHALRCPAIEWPGLIALSILLILFSSHLMKCQITAMPTIKSPRRNVPGSRFSYENFNTIAPKIASTIVRNIFLTATGRVANVNVMHRYV